MLIYEVPFSKCEKKGKIHCLQRFITFGCTIWSFGLCLETLHFSSMITCGGGGGQEFN